MSEESELAISKRREMGELLVRRREALGVTQSGMATQLHMRETHIRWLEEGDFSKFSAEIYVRGAYLRYAKALGLPNDEVERALYRSLSSDRQPVRLRIYTPARFLERMLTPKLLMSVFGIGMALLVGGYVAAQVRSFWQLPDLAWDSPQELVVDQDMIVIAGSSDFSARLRLNGETILLGEDGRFEEEAFLHRGINIFRLEAENAAGRINVLERHVLRKD